MLDVRLEDREASAAAPSLSPAPLWRRCLAAFVDLLVLLAAFALLELPLFLFAPDWSLLLADPDRETTPLQLVAHALEGLAHIGIAAAYLTQSMRRMDGQTPGKRLLGVRVAQLDGAPPTATTIGRRSRIYAFAGLTAAGGIVVVAGYVIDARLTDRGTNGHAPVVVAGVLATLLFTAIAASTLRRDRRSIVDRHVGTVVVSGRCTPGTASVAPAQLAPAPSRELIWFVPLLLAVTAVGIAVDQPWNVRIDDPDPRTDADRLAIVAAERLAAGVQTCLRSGKSATVCSEPRTYQDYDLDFARHRAGESMDFNPNGRYVGKVEINGPTPGGGAVVYSYADDRVWMIGPVSRDAVGARECHESSSLNPEYSTLCVDVPWNGSDPG